MTITDKLAHIAAMEVPPRNSDTEFRKLLDDCIAYQTEKAARFAATTTRGEG